MFVVQVDGEVPTVMSLRALGAVELARMVPGRADMDRAEFRARERAEEFVTAYLAQFPGAVVEVVDQAGVQEIVGARDIHDRVTRVVAQRDRYRHALASIVRHPDVEASVMVDVARAALEER